MDHLLQFACHSCAAMPGALFLSVKTLFQLRFDLPAGKPRGTPYTKSRSKSRRASIIGAWPESPTASSLDFACFRPDGIRYIQWG